MRIRRILCLSAWHPTPGTVKPSKREFTPSWLVGMRMFAEHCLGVSRPGSRCRGAGRLPALPAGARWCHGSQMVEPGSCWPPRPAPGHPPAPAWPPGRRPARGWGSRSRSPAPPSRAPPRVGLGVCSARPCSEGALVSQDAADRGRRCAEWRQTHVRGQ